MITWNVDLPFLFLKKELNKGAREGFALTGFSHFTYEMGNNYGVTNSFL